MPKEDFFVVAQPESGLVRPGHFAGSSWSSFVPRAVVPKQRPGATKRQTVSATALLADQHAFRGTAAAQVR